MRSHDALREKITSLVAYMNGTFTTAQIVHAIMIVIEADAR